MNSRDASQVILARKREYNLCFFYPNFNESEARRYFMEKQLKEKKINMTRFPAERVTAIDYPCLGDDELKASGIFKTWNSIWGQAGLQEGCDFVGIVEDDTVLQEFDETLLVEVIRENPAAVYHLTKKEGRREGWFAEGDGALGNLFSNALLFNTGLREDFRPNSKYMKYYDQFKFRPWKLFIHFHMEVSLQERFRQSFLIHKNCPPDWALKEWILENNIPVYSYPIISSNELINMSTTKEIYDRNGQSFVQNIVL